VEERFLIVRTENAVMITSLKLLGKPSCLNLSDLPDRIVPAVAFVKCEKAKETLDNYMILDSGYSLGVKIKAKRDLSLN